jgi:hypothetical protein
VSRRSWNGVRVEVSEWQGAGTVSHKFRYQTETRLVTLLKEVGSPCEPRLRFSDDRIWPLVKLLSDAVYDPDPSTQLYGDGLTAAIIARLLADPAQPASARRAPSTSGMVTGMPTGFDG